MKLLMAISKDGFVCKDENDDMSWTSKTDKKIFRLLTQTDGHGPYLPQLFCGYKTGKLLPKLKNRQINIIEDWVEFGFGYIDDNGAFNAVDTCLEDGHLIGGQKTALKAFERILIHKAYICRSEVELGDGVKDKITPILKKRFSLSDTIKINDVTVEIWNIN